MTATGGTVAASIDVAAETPDADVGFFGLMALVGLYVGVIPVAIGMLWLPWVRRIDPRWVQFLLALTLGLLAFLGIDALLEGTGVRRLGLAGLRRSGAGVPRRGRRLSRAGGRRRLAARGESSARAEDGAGPWRLAFLVALGIGLHNLGEGLAIGSAYAIGSLALGAALIVGFALHNTTEGLAIVAPVAKDGEAAPATASLRRLAGLGLLAGLPAVLGAWIGASAFNPSLAAFMFGLGAGAIAQVIVQIAPERARLARAACCTRSPWAASSPGWCSCTPPDCWSRSDGRRSPTPRRGLGRGPGLREGDLLAARALGRARVHLGDRRSPRRLARPRRRRWSSAWSRSGLARREPYHGVELTPAGERVALEVIRHHRLLELYLAEALGMPWDRVHEEAEVLEHAISPELSELIARQARQSHPRPPRRPDPHRRRARSRRAARARWPSSSRASAGSSCACRTPTPRCCATSPRAGSRPATAFEVLERQPFDGPLIVRFGSGDHALGGALVRMMRVQADRAGRLWPACRSPRTSSASSTRLPPDWTQLELDLRILDEERYVETATLLTQINAMPYSQARLALAAAGGARVRPRRRGPDRAGHAGAARRPGHRRRDGGARGPLGTRGGRADVGPPGVGAPGVRAPPRPQ